MFRVLRDCSAAFPPATQRDVFSVLDSLQQSVKSVASECFAPLNDNDKALGDLFVFSLLCLYGLLSKALFNKLSDNMLP